MVSCLLSRCCDLSGLVEQLFEGCITLEKKEKDALISASLNSDESNPVKRRVISSSGKRWQAKNIPYKIADVGFSGQSKGEIRLKKLQRALYTRDKPLLYCEKLKLQLLSFLLT